MSWCLPLLDISNQLSKTILLFTSDLKIPSLHNFDILPLQTSTKIPSLFSLHIWLLYEMRPWCILCLLSPRSVSCLPPTTNFFPTLTTTIIPSFPLHSLPPTRAPFFHYRLSMYSLWYFFLYITAFGPCSHYVYWELASPLFDFVNLSHIGSFIWVSCPMHDCHSREAQGPIFGPQNEWHPNVRACFPTIWNQYHPYVNGALYLFVTSSAFVPCLNLFFFLQDVYLVYLTENRLFSLMWNYHSSLVARPCDFCLGFRSWMQSFFVLFTHRKWYF